MKLFGSQKNVAGLLEVGGISVRDLASRFSTPLFIYDEGAIIDRIREFKEEIRNNYFDTEIIYAGKAFLCLYMADLIAEEDLSLDVVSGGELMTASEADFPMERVYFHGNNKLEKEIDLALDRGVGCFILDNEDEFKRLEGKCRERGIKKRVLLRVNPGIEAHTHEYIKTTKDDSKFGLSIYEDSTLDLLKRINQSEHLIFEGLHCHIGSQIFEEESYLQAAEIMLEFRHKIKLFAPSYYLNLGGGFGVYYTEGDEPFDLGHFFNRLTKLIVNKCDLLGDSYPKLLIEPGRSLINNYCLTLYRAGNIKHTHSGKNYIMVDGGMTDNIRPALYQAEYEACLAERMDEEEDHIYTIAGKCCESGDIIVEGAKLPRAEEGDLVAVSSTGAYCYSMAMNYNRVERPAVVFVRDGRANLAIRRESYMDLIKNDMRREK